VAAANQAIAKYAESFGGFEYSAGSHELVWLRKLRQDGFARFSEVGFPTTRERGLAVHQSRCDRADSFRLVRNDHSLPSHKDIELFRLPGAGCQLVFVNGRFVPGLSLIPKLPAGVTVSSLAAEIARNPGAIEKHLGRYLDMQRDAFGALNTAFLEDGAYVHIAKGVVLESPVAVLFVSTEQDSPAVNHPRT